MKKSHHHYHHDVADSDRRCVSESARPCSSSSGQSTCEYECPATISYFPSSNFCDKTELVKSVDDTSIISRRGKRGRRKESMPVAINGSNNVILISNTPTKKCFQALQSLFDQGFIDAEELEARKQEVMQQGKQRQKPLQSVPPAFQSTACPEKKDVLPSQWVQGIKSVVPSKPPVNFGLLRTEAATRYIFDYERMQWDSDEVLVQLDPTPFAKGSLRVVYHLQLYEQPLNLNSASSATSSSSFVAKISIDPHEDPQTYFRDIELQAHCAYYAQLYNQYSPPKRVTFVTGWVLELSQRRKRHRGKSSKTSSSDVFLVAVEPYIDGVYRKHNNNYGAVSEDERHTPQAFSHFTYEASNHELLAVDIQGVQDRYTDPQIHTIDGSAFGKGNLGLRGFAKFLDTHRCNPICRYLKLPMVANSNSTTDDSSNSFGRAVDDGRTVPMQKVMNSEGIRHVHFESKHYFEQAPRLQKFIVECRKHEKRSGAENASDKPLSIFDCESSTQYCCIVQ